MEHQYLVLRQEKSKMKGCAILKLRKRSIKYSPLGGCNQRQL